MNLDERMIALENMEMSEYDILHIQRLEDINSCGLILKHRRSGARVVVITNDDNNKVFSIGFKTPPTNNTGLQHILEHSTLCGSRKYPVKDPFVELCKGSLNTFLNAMTYPDKTVYPVASCNDVDFKNIMDVYMDAVFYPDIYRNKKIFMQEGWHYELNSLEEDIIYNGVVYNEMKGVYSSPDDVLSRLIFVSLFPDTVYQYESGGDPVNIPELTYEGFLEYHKNFYHPVNSYIYLYGDMDVKERLDYLHEEYLKNFDANEVSIDSSIALQSGFDKIKYETHEYAITEDENLENNAYISYNRVVGASTDPFLCMAIQVLDYALIMAPGAKLKQAIVDKKLGSDVYSIYESSMAQPVYSVVVKDADENRQDEFIATVEEVLRDIVDNGIDERMILAGINFYEFKYREADFGSYPKGLMYYLTMMDSWLYDDSKPFVHIENSEVFRRLRQTYKDGIFENIIKEYLLDNTHGSVITLVPRRGLMESREEALAAKLKAVKESMSTQMLQSIIDDTAMLKAYQDEPSSQEDLMSIPMLKLEDIEKKAQPLYIDPKKVSDITVVHSNIFTNEIGYVLMSFNCDKVPERLIPYLGLLATTLGLMDTDSFTYKELSNEININCGGISTDASIYSNDRVTGEYSIRYEIKGKVLKDKIPFLLDMMEEIIYHTKFDDYKRLEEIIARVKSRLETSMTSGGHNLAFLYGTSQFSPYGYYSNLMRGYKYYEMIDELHRDYDKLKEDIAKNLRECAYYIFNRDNLVISFTGDDECYDSFANALAERANHFREAKLDSVVREFTPGKSNRAFTSSSQVLYVARCGNFINKGYKYTGALKVLKVIFSYDYLWVNIRVKGGAYGCMSGFSKNGDMYMVSYRDPNLSKTNEIYEKAYEYVADFKASDRDMLKYIIGTIGEMDTPLTPAAKGSRSFTAYISNAVYEDYQRVRDEVLATNEDTIRGLSDLIKDAIDDNYLCVVGNQKIINQEKELFTEVVPLFKNA